MIEILIYIVSSFVLSAIGFYLLIFSKDESSDSAGIGAILISLTPAGWLVILAILIYFIWFYLKKFYKHAFKKNN